MEMTIFTLLMVALAMTVVALVWFGLH